MLNLLLKKTINQNQTAPDRGFTLLEVIVITIILGILAGVAAPSWFGFLQTQRLNTAQGEINQAIQRAQRLAKQNSTSWQVSFRETTVNGETVVQWRTENEIDPDPDVFWDESLSGGWNSLDSRITLDATNTNLESNDSNTGWRTQFDYEGKAVSDNGSYSQKRITLSVENSDEKRCVIVSTILGNLRQAKGTECEPPPSP